MDTAQRNQIIKVVLLLTLFFLSVFSLISTWKTITQDNGEQEEVEAVTAAEKEKFALTDIRFELIDKFFWSDEYLIYVDTEKETFVFRADSTQFVKSTTDENTLSLINSGEKNTYLYDFGYEEVVIEVSEENVSELSREYVEAFKKNIEFVQLESK